MKSKCCKSYLKVCEGEESTNFYRCASCGLPSDPFIDQKDIPLSEALFNLTLAASKAYLSDKEHKTIDRQMWAFLHVGFAEALKIEGHSDEDVQNILKGTQDLMTESKMFNNGK